MGIVSLEKLTTFQSLESAILKVAGQLEYNYKIIQKEDKTIFKLNPCGFFMPKPIISIEIYGKEPYNLLDVYPAEGEYPMKYLALVFKYLDSEQIK